MENQTIWIIIIASNILIYGLCCFLIYKRKQFSGISVRSPMLLLCTNISNFAMSMIILLHKLFESNILSIFYYLFRLMMMIAFFLRYERILTCFKYNSDKFNIKLNIEKFAEKRYLLQEKYYVKIYIGLCLIICITLLIIELVGVPCFELFYNSYNINNDSYKSQLYIWIFLNFFELTIIMTYIFRLYPKKIRFLLKKELYFSFLFLFIYFNYTSFSNLYYEYNDTEFTFISLISLYIFLILNGFIPIFATFWYKKFLSYQFTPKLMNNLYIFLTDKDNYRAFHAYLINRNDNSIFFLKLYTHIMKYKLDIKLNFNNEIILREAKDIYNKYFNEEKELIISQDILIKIRNECEILKEDRVREDLFDEGLKYSYDKLNIIFNDFIKTYKFKELYEDVEIKTLVQCKMCNTGLINKF